LNLRWRTAGGYACAHREGDDYHDDPDCEAAILAHAASGYIPRLQGERPDLSGPLLWLEATKLAREAGLSIDPLD
jgi:hypothetical protein